MLEVGFGVKKHLGTVQLFQGMSGASCEGVWHGRGGLKDVWRSFRNLSATSPMEKYP